MSQHTTDIRTRRPRRPLFAVASLMLWTIAATPTDLAAQGHVRAMGMGGAYTAAARGLDAVDWNPANLVIRRDNGLMIGLASVAVDVKNNSYSLARYNEVSGATLTQADKQILLDDIPAEGFILDANVRASVLGVCAGPFAMSIQGLAGGTGVLDKDFFDLILMGNDIGSSFDFDNTNGEAYAMASATLSWATPLVTRRTHRLALGVNARYLHGLYDVMIEEATGGILVDMSGVHGSADAAYLTSRGGTGWAVDVGLALQAPRGWTFGLNIGNAASSLTWDRDVERSEWHATADSLTAATEDFEAATTTSDTTYAVSSYDTALPTVVSLGASNRWGRLLYAVDVSRALESRMGTSSNTAVNAGVEMRLASWFRPRLGAGLGGVTKQRSSVGLGLGLGPVKWDIAVANHGKLVPNDTKGLSFASAFGLEF